MIHKNTIPVQSDGSSIRQHGDWFYLENDKTEPSGRINNTAALLWQLSDGLRTIGDIAFLLHDHYPEVGHYLDIDLVDGFRALVNNGGLLLTPPVSMDGECGLAELGILFIYHKVDAVTCRHLDLLTYFNPLATVILLGHNLSATLESPLETVDVGQFDSRWDLSNPWRSLDAIIYTWFLNRKKSAKRYLLAEYDYHCTMPVQAAYKEVWNADVAAKKFFLQKDYPAWQWFTEISRLTPSDQPFAAGVPPLAGILLSHHALDILSQEAGSANIFSELRLGTTAHRAKLKIVTFPDSLARNIDYRQRDFNFSQPGIFHPVKRYITHERPVKETNNVVQGASGESNHNKVVLTCPVGRRRYLEILIRYVDELYRRGLIDSFHMWVNTEVVEDISFIDRIALEREWVIRVYRQKPDKGFGVTPFFDYCTDPDTLYVRVDDDIVYLDLEHFQDFVDYRRQNPHYFLVYANTVNNVLCSCLHQRFGQISYEAGTVEWDAFDSTGWQSSKFAQLAHQSFFNNFASDKLERYRFHEWGMHYEERLSTHVISWLGTEFAQFSGIVEHHDDEHWLSCVKPALVKKQNVIYGKMLASHLAYHTQRDGLDEQRLLAGYKRIADSEGI